MSYAPSWLAWEAASGGRAILHGTPEEIKSQYTGLAQALFSMLPPPTENVSVTSGKVKHVGYRIYTPKDLASETRLPILIWAHGGGWMTGDLDTDDILCRNISEKMQFVVVNVDYRLTPETVIPGQLEDCLEVYRWVHANASSFSGDATKILTAGGSAGACLALQTANAVVQDPALKSSLKGVVALQPMTAHWESIPEKYKEKYTSYTENEKDTPIIDKESMEIFFRAAKADPHDSSLFTLLATENHPNFPPVYFSSCEFDPLRDDAFVMEAALKEAGVKTKHDYWKGMPHYFWIFPPVQPEGEQFLNKVFEGMEWLKGMM